MRIFTLFCFLIITVSAYAQHKPGKELNIRRAASPVVLDGVLDEPDWQQADVATGFYLNYPVDSLPPTYQSEVKVTFNDQFLYFGIVCYDDASPDIVQSLRRDIDWDLNDNMGIYMDPFNDFTNGFYFTITPMGVQSEGILSNGGSNDSGFNDNWDNKWYSKVQRLHDRWVAEIAIPFKTIRYNRTNWNITFLRNDVKRNQISSWIATPIQYIPASIAYSGKLIWLDPAPHPGANISFIPYVSGGVQRDRENNEPQQHNQNIGFDAKVGLTPSLNLDLTVNPDFSQVEVDRQVINLTRFEFGFPERRQFFLENSDLFSSPGFPDSRPFFSRRIGIARDSADKLQRLPILYGARVSGKLGKDWRIGLLNMQTREKKSVGLPDQNYSVAVVQRQVFSRSNLGFVFVNKQSVGLGSYDSTRFYHKSLLREVYRDSRRTYDINRYNRTFGVDFNLFTKSNRWQGDVYYHRSVDEVGPRKHNYSFGSYLGYNSRHLNLFIGQQALGKNFNAEVGFVPGLDVYPGYLAGFTGAEYRFYPTNTALAVMGPSVSVDYTMLPDGTRTDRTVNASYQFSFLNTASLEVGARNIYQKLPEDFNPLDPRGDSTLLAGQQFRWNETWAEFQSDTRKIFNYQLRAGWGGFYNGTLFNVGGNVNVRYQPYGSLAVQFDYNKLDFPQAYGRADFLLVGPRLDLTFTDKLFLTTFVQYNNRDDNVNLNTRFQWRFKPASDFFVVYTENYLPQALGSKNRALVAKLTYWFNL